MIEPSLCEGLAMLIRHEGFRGQPYQDTKGNWTIGFGRNLAEHPFTPDESLYWMQHHLFVLQDDLQQKYPWFQKLNIPRKWVALNMCYHMGMRGFASFKKMIGHIENAVKMEEHYTEKHFWENAKIELLDSQAARNFPDRYRELGEIMQRGCW